MPLKMRSVFNRKQLENELDDEIRYHLDRQREESMAHGAERRSVRWMVLKQGVALTCIGAMIGLAAAGGTARILSTAIPGLPVGGPATLLIMTLVLLAVACIACYFPARQASKVDPIIALRQD
jgi:ABC-type antimicrobial peptide transport system permease subunit